MNLLDVVRGYKTFAITGAGIGCVPEVVHQLLVPYLSTQGITVNAHGEAWLVSLCMGAIGITMRFVSRTPPGKLTPPFVSPLPESPK